MRHPVAAQFDRIANAALGLHENPTGKPLPRCQRLGSEGGLAPGCIQIVPGGIEGLDEYLRGLGIERGRGCGRANAFHAKHTAQLAGLDNPERREKFRRIPDP